MRSNHTEMIGKTYGELTVTDMLINTSDNQTYAVCQCSCGNTKNVLPYMLNNGSVISCGCVKTRRAKTLSSHKKSKTPWNYKGGIVREELYGTWRQMLYRCENPNSYAYKHYGLRGISVCDEWHDFASFKEWCVTYYPDRTNKTLDRIDVNGNYCPDNCRFVTFDVQCNNKRTSRYISFNGKTLTIGQWAEILGINYRTLSNRINRGWSVERALTEELH